MAGSYLMLNSINLLCGTSTDEAHIAEYNDMKEYMVRTHKVYAKLLIIFRVLAYLQQMIDKAAKNFLYLRSK